MKGIEQDGVARHFCPRESVAEFEKLPNHTIDSRLSNPVHPLHPFHPV